MFQLETEDMLPRMAPKPTAPTPTLGMNGDSATMKPQVPEVSLLFGGTYDPRQQQQQQQQHYHQCREQQPSYATWRKQVSKTAALENETNNERMGGGYCLTHNGYSLSSRSFPTSSSTSTASVTRALSADRTIVTGGTSSNTNKFQSIESMQSSYRSALPPVFYRQNNDPNEEYLLLPSGIAASTFATADKNATPPKNIPTPHSVRTCQREVLTICAGTQTDSTLQEMSSQSTSADGNKNCYASKADVEQLMEIVEHMREDQLRLMQICESLLGMSQQVNLHKEENVAIQCDDRANTSSLSSHESKQVDEIACGGENYGKRDQDDLVVAKEEAEEVDSKTFLEKKSVETKISNQLYGKRICARNPVLEQLKQQSGNLDFLQTPKGNPVAQSTVYRIQTPRTLPIGDKETILNYEQQSADKYSTIRSSGSNMPALLPKPSTENSLFMNELAIKYLPNEKLAELLQDMNMDGTDSNCLDVVSNVRLTPPLQSVENFEKKATEISSASYKYLKKYRLLPEDHMSADTLSRNDKSSPKTLSRNYHQTRSDCAGAEVITERDRSFRYHIGASGGKEISSLYREKCLPRLINGRRLPTSPLAQPSSASNNKLSIPKSPLATNMLDLDNIKQQPKLL